jgi:hypothetical protein
VPEFKGFLLWVFLSVLAALGDLDGVFFLKAEGGSEE